MKKNQHKIQDKKDNTDSDARYLDLEIKDKEEKKVPQDKIEDISDVQEASNRDGYSAELGRDRLNSWNNRREAKLRKSKERKRSKFFNNLKILARNLFATIKRTNSILLWPSNKIKQNFIWIKRGVQKEHEKLLDKQREINRLAVARNRSLQRQRSDLSQQLRLLSKIKLVIQPILLMLRKPPSTQYAQNSHSSVARSLQPDKKIYPQKLQMSTKYTANEQQTTRNDYKSHNLIEKGSATSTQEFSKGQNFHQDTHENRVSFLFPPQPIGTAKASLGITASLTIKLDILPILIRPVPPKLNIKIIKVTVVEFSNIRQPGSLMTTASQSMDAAQNLPAHGPDIRAR
jgi:hypothetical protein